jgi:hypothetical protein
MQLPWTGTSFAAPLVAGAAALVQEKCQGLCSPLAIKALLMNHAVPVVASANATTPAPVSLQGSGALQIDQSLAATFWVYSVEDLQPSISLGLINVDRNLQIQRTLRVVQLSSSNQAAEHITLQYQLRTPPSRHPAAMEIEFTPAAITFPGNCPAEFLVQVTFHIDATWAPSNRMSSSGFAGTDPSTLDYNEMDGWIILSSTRDGNHSSNSNSTTNHVGVPFHMILRKAAHVTMDVSSSLDDSTLNGLPTNLTVNIENHGAEVAQIDAYELLYVSTDQSESEYGSNNPPADIRYIGYRTLPIHDVPDCTTLIEFAIQTWESQQSLFYTHFNIWIDTNFDEMAEYTIFNSGYRLGSAQSEMRRIHESSALEYCIGFAPDHATNTANTVLRFCSEDIGIMNTTKSDVIVNVAISSFSFPEDKVADVMEYRNISIRQVGLSAPSYDIEPGAVLHEICLSGRGGSSPSTAVAPPLGLLLFTNAFRSSTSTGSATRASEAIAILRPGIQQHAELSPNTFEFPVAQDVVGPGCSWHQPNMTLHCAINRDRRLRWNTTSPASSSKRHSSIQDNSLIRDELFLPHEHKTVKSNDLQSLRRRHLQSQETCPEFRVPRLNPITITKLEHPILSVDGTIHAPSSGGGVMDIFHTDDPKSSEDDGLATPTQPPNNAVQSLAMKTFSYQCSFLSSVLIGLSIIILDLLLF